MILLNIKSKNVHFSDFYVCVTELHKYKWQFTVKSIVISLCTNSKIKFLEIFQKKIFKLVCIQSVYIDNCIICHKTFLSSLLANII